MSKELQELREENERLQRLVEDHKRERKSMGKANAEMAERVEDAEAEVERLREALEVERHGISHYSRGAHLSVDPSGTREREER